MTPKPSKTALLIAAMATAVTLTSLSPASAKAYWVSADAETADIVPINAKFKVKKYGGYKHRGYKYHAPKYHGYKKKKHVSSRTKAKKLILKKLF